MVTEQQQGVSVTEQPAQDKYVRLATPRDFPAVDEIVQAAYSNDYGDTDDSWDLYRQAHKRTQYPLDIWVVCRRETDEIIGTLSSRIFGQRPVYEESLATDMDLRLLATSPRARREGVAALLLTHVRKQAAAQGFKRVVLKTVNTWDSALKLYAGIGWDHYSERDGIWHDGVKDPEINHVVCFSAPALAD